MITVSKQPLIRLFHGDCMETMADMKDNEYDLAIVDTPYGIGESGKTNKTRGKLAKAKDFGNKDWDKESPSGDYFSLLKSRTENQIIWGCNHFISKIPYDSSCWVVWDKDNGKTDFADCELAWTSFKSAVRIFKYKWLLQNYAKPGKRVLDTHGGSMSIAIACYDLGFDLDLWEVDEDYFKAGVERVQNHIKQGQLFNPAQKRPEPVQLTIT